MIAESRGWEPPTSWRRHTVGTLRAVRGRHPRPERLVRFKATAGRLPRREAGPRPFSKLLPSQLSASFLRRLMSASIRVSLQPAYPGETESARGRSVSTRSTWSVRIRGRSRCRPVRDAGPPTRALTGAHSSSPSRSGASRSSPASRTSTSDGSRTARRVPSRPARPPPRPFPPSRSRCRAAPK